jgi:hypothetical protein
MLVLTPSLYFPCVVRLRTCDSYSDCLFPGGLFLSPEMWWVHVSRLDNVQPDVIWIYRTAYYPLFLSLGISLFDRLYFAEAGQVKTTVDDTDPWIIYEPTAAWFFNGNTSGCTVCLTPPSPSVAYNNTWHYGLHTPQIQRTNDTNNANGRKRSDGTSAEGTTSKRRNDMSSGRRAAADSSRDLPVSVQLKFNGLSHFFINDRS